jgi:hypothetical protein
VSYAGRNSWRCTWSCPGVGDVFVNFFGAERVPYGAVVQTTFEAVVFDIVGRQHVQVLKTGAFTRTVRPRTETPIPAARRTRGGRSSRPLWLSGRCSEPELPVACLP